MKFFDPPEPFLEVRVHDLGLTPGVTGLCVGYEEEKWRVKQFVKHVMEWLPECVLNYSQLRELSSGTAIKQIRAAAQRVYETDEYKGRGEFGELFLHIAIRQVFGSVPAIAKLFFKSANNDTVKGFDAVHVVSVADELELWLGEVKFYQDGKDAIQKVVKEIDEHIQNDYLRSEFNLISSKIDPEWPDAEKLKKLISVNTSLDEVFSRTCIPVLVTYDSACLASHTKVDATYKKAFEAEILMYHNAFATKKLPAKLRVHLFLLPLNTKELLVAELDKQLKAWQAI